MNHNTLQEGPRDPHIFKAVFTAGIPGSGKTTIVKELVAGSGLKLVGFDEVYMFLKSRGASHQAALTRAQSMATSQLKTYLDGRLGLIIDKTSWDYPKVMKLKQSLESFGYDTLMVYVNTDLNVAKRRVLARYKETGRRVDVEYIDDVFSKLSSNIGKYQQDFGNNFVVVDNTDSRAGSSLGAGLTYAKKKVGAFLRAPITNPIAKRWIAETP